MRSITSGEWKVNRETVAPPRYHFDYDRSSYSLVYVPIKSLFDCRYRFFCLFSMREKNNMPNIFCCCFISLIKILLFVYKSSLIIDWYDWRVLQPLSRTSKNQCEQRSYTHKKMKENKKKKKKNNLISFVLLASSVFYTEIQL